MRCPSVEISRLDWVSLSIFTVCFSYDLCELLEHPEYLVPGGA